MDYEIGQVFILKQKLLDNPKRTLGIVIDKYYYGLKNPGYLIIFENGNIDGFSTEDNYNEINKFLNNPKLILSNFSFIFTNVIKTTDMFNNGFFKKYFKEAKLLLNLNGV